jgi:hypothetical protein
VKIQAFIYETKVRLASTSSTGQREERKRRHTTIAAIPIPHEEATLRHLPQIELMQELALLPLLAQSSQPMLADQVVEVGI